MSLARVLTRGAAALLVCSGVAAAQQIVPNPLLTVDQNRTTVVDRIVAEWGDALANSGSGLEAPQLRAMLSGLRADHLLTASLAGSLDGLRNALSTAVTSTAEGKASLIRPKALGDANDDLVYTPVVPCRILDTRNGTAPPYNMQLVGGSAFPVAANLASFATQGGAATNCNLPPSFSAIAVVFTVLNPNFDAFMAASNSSNFSTLTQAVVMDFSANKGLANTAIVPVDGTVKFYLGLPALVSTHVIADVVGYFKPPSGTIQPSRILWVAPSGGNYTSVQAAIDAAATVATANSRWVVKIAPGVYVQPVTLKDFVDVEGSGYFVTTIASTAAGGTLTAGANSELREVLIYNNFNGASPGAIAIAQSGNSPNGMTHLRNVIAATDGPTDNTAVYVTGGSLQIVYSGLVAALSATQTGVETALWGAGATTDVSVFSSLLTVGSGTTKISARRDSGARVGIASSSMSATTTGTPLCFNNFDPSTYTLAACP